MRPTPSRSTRAVARHAGVAVHDVLAHMVGVTDDVVNGRLDGIASDAWTQTQVDAAARRTDRPTARRVGRHRPAVRGSCSPARRPRSPGQALFDAATHEHDLRHALGAPGRTRQRRDRRRWEWMVGARTAHGGPAHPLRHRAAATTVAGAATRPRRCGRPASSCCGRAPAAARADEIAAYGWDPEPATRALARRAASSRSAPNRSTNNDRVSITASSRSTCARRCGR